MDDQRDTAEEAYNAELLRNPDGIEADRGDVLRDQIEAADAIHSELGAAGFSHAAFLASRFARDLRDELESLEPELRKSDREADRG